MKKPIEVTLLPEAEEFVDKIEVSAKKKLFFAIRKRRNQEFLETGSKNLKVLKTFMNFALKTAISLIVFLLSGTRP